MIHIRIKVTLPLLVVLLLAVLIWLIRDPSQGRQQPVPRPPRRPDPTRSSNISGHKRTRPQAFDDRAESRAQDYIDRANQELSDRLHDFVEGKSRVRTTD